MTVFTHYTPRTGLKVIAREKALELFSSLRDLDDVVVLGSRGSRSWFDGAEFLCAIHVPDSDVASVPRAGLVVKRLAAAG